MPYALATKSFGRLERTIDSQRRSASASGPSMPSVVGITKLMPACNSETASVPVSVAVGPADAAGWTDDAASASLWETPAVIR
jgi:hypothetical protein